MRRVVIAAVLVAIAAGAVYGYIERRVRSASEEAFQAAIEEIHGERAKVQQGALAEAREREALKAEVARNREALRLLAGRSAGAAAATAQDRVAAEALMAHPSWSALQEAATRLHVTIKPVVR